MTTPPQDAQKGAVAPPSDVPIFCIYGNHVWFAPSVEKVIEVMREFRRFVSTVDSSMMDAWEEAAHKEKAEHLLSPSPSELRRSLKRHGYLTIACLDCNAAVSQEMYRRLGQETMKVGVTLIDPSLIDEPRVQEQIKEYGLNRNVSPYINFDAILGTQPPLQETPMRREGEG